MKKFLLLFLTFLLVAAISSASAGFLLCSVDQAQYFLYRHSPEYFLTNALDLEVEGTVRDLTETGPNNHCDFTLVVDEPKAAVPISEERPIVHVHFRLHVEEIPFREGDTVTVRGGIDPLYSSYMVPYVIAEFINGSDEF